MTHNKVIEYINFVSNKYQEGLVLTPEQYITLANVYNNLLFQREYEMVEVMAKQQGITLYEALHNSTSLRVFKAEAVIALVNGVGQLPSDYVFCYSVEGKIGDPGNMLSPNYDLPGDELEIKTVSIVSEMEFALNRSDILNNAEANPVGVLSSTFMRVIPPLKYYPSVRSYTPSSVSYITHVTYGVGIEVEFTGADVRDYFYDGQIVTVNGTTDELIDGIEAELYILATDTIGVFYPGGVGSVTVDLPNITVEYNACDSGVNMVYLRKPADINFDYCIIEDTDTILYMPVNSYIDYTNGFDDAEGYTLYSDGTPLSTGVIHNIAAVYPYISQSVEFEWEDRMMTKIMGMILEAMGVNLKDQFVFEHGKMSQQ